ncbi:MAG: hypothetical protein L3J03_01160 [Desulfobacterales bacterium]|nr:hypothetical protein [Desulfobacterales bacterium]
MLILDELQLPPALRHHLVELYAEMEQAYDEVAGQLGHTCRDCPDNCCDSYFLHHTYIEWAYLREGLHSLPEDEQQAIVARAREYVRQSELILAAGQRPSLLCPLNEQGLCVLYTHRLLICRLHGVPATISRPDGRTTRFPGCFRCQELVGDRPDPPAMDRTVLFQRMVELEMTFLQGRRQMPRVRMTLARMLIQGPA